MQMENGFVDRPTAGGPALAGLDRPLVGHDLDAVRTAYGEWIDAFDGGDR